MKKRSRTQCMDTTQINADEYLKYAKKWGEGYKELEDLLFTCLQNGIQTWACCSGHEGEKSPYIVFIINEQNGKIIDEIATAFKDFDGVKMDYSSRIKKGTRIIPSKMSIHFPRGTDLKVFAKMNEICKEPQKKHEKDESFINIREIIETVNSKDIGDLF